LQPVHLHQLLRYDRWTLLLATARADAATVRTLREICAESPAAVDIIAITAAGNPDAVRRAGQTGDLKLIRPDGYVGLIAPLDRPDVLRDYLAAVFLLPAGTAAFASTAIQQWPEVTP
jgi:hypothetical protein